MKNGFFSVFSVGESCIFLRLLSNTSFDRSRLFFHYVNRNRRFLKYIYMMTIWPSLLFRFQLPQMCQREKADRELIFVFAC